MGEPYAAEELYDEGETRTYSREASALTFPLGGVGTGNVSLGVRGQLRDWELFNSPGKGTELPYAFFAIRCARADPDAEPVTRVLEAQRTPPHTEWTGHPPTTTAGLPRLDDVTFRGEYPVADLTFHDGDLPVRVSLSAYTPFVPLDPEASGIPCAVLEYTVENPTPDPIDVSLMGSLPNAAGFLGREPFETNSVAHPAVGGNRNEIRHRDRLDGLYYTTERYDEAARRYGEFALCLLDADTGSDGLEVTHTAAWPREDWWNAYQHV